MPPSSPRKTALPVPGGKRSVSPSVHCEAFSSPYLAPQLILIVIFCRQGVVHVLQLTRLRPTLLSQVLELVAQGICLEVEACRIQACPKIYVATMIDFPALDDRTRNL